MPTDESPQLIIKRSAIETLSPENSNKKAFGRLLLADFYSWWGASTIFDLHPDTYVRPTLTATALSRTCSMNQSSINTRMADWICVTEAELLLATASARVNALAMRMSKTSARSIATRSMCVGGGGVLYATRVDGGGGGRSTLTATEGLSGVPSSTASRAEQPLPVVLGRSETAASSSTMQVKSCCCWLAAVVVDWSGTVSGSVVGSAHTPVSSWETYSTTADMTTWRCSWRSSHERTDCRGR